MNDNPSLDPRLNVFSPDLADIRLKDRVAAAMYVAGAPFRVITPSAPFFILPDAMSTRVATKLLGETVRVFDAQSGWAWAQSERDDYVGYVRESQIAEGGFDDKYSRDCETVIVVAPRAPIFLQPSAKARALTWAPMGARLALDPVSPPKNGFHLLAGEVAGGWVFEQHFRTDATPAPPDWVAAAEQMLNAPYLWGGDTVEGVDCSGLVAAARRCAGLDAPRDSDLQEASVGGALSDGAELRRGDLVFWRGHVGVMADEATLLHATAHAMAVVKEPIDEAIARIARSEYGEPRSFRRAG